MIDKISQVGFEGSTVHNLAPVVDIMDDFFRCHSNLVQGGREAKEGRKRCRRIEKRGKKTRKRKESLKKVKMIKG